MTCPQERFGFRTDYPGDNRLQLNVLSQDPDLTSNHAELNERCGVVQDASASGGQRAGPVAALPQRADKAAALATQCPEAGSP